MSNVEHTRMSFEDLRNVLGNIQETLQEARSTGKDIVSMASVLSKRKTADILFEVGTK